MITTESFLGLSLRTHWQRRRLIVLYYCVIFSLALLMVWRPNHTYPALFGQCFLLGGLLGGIRRGGPVKPYGNRSGSYPRDATGEPLSLDLNGELAKRNQAQQLDERELGERDTAHYTAYRILLPSLGLLALFVVVMADLFPTWMATRTPALLWTLLVYALSLPQAVLLWTEPVQPGELYAIEA